LFVVVGERGKHRPARWVVLAVRSSFEHLEHLVQLAALALGSTAKTQRNSNWQLGVHGLLC
jgi:hypothetical protein